MLLQVLTPVVCILAIFAIYLKDRLGNGKTTNRRPHTYGLEGTAIGMCIGCAAAEGFGFNLGAGLAVGLIIGLVAGVLKKKKDSDGESDKKE